MKNRVVLRQAGLLAVLPALLAGAISCSQGSSSSPVAPTLSGGTIESTRPTNPGPNVGAPDLELFEVCKVYSGGTGPDVTINADVDIDNNGSIDDSFSVVLSAGECEDLWVAGGAPFDRITVTEVAPTGYTTSFVRSTIVGTITTTDPPVSGTVASGLINGNTGVTVTFTNTAAPPPPAGEGCTPGYWKQPHHFDSWPAAYLPSDLFSSVFDDAFPGMTLLEVAAQGGGGLKALGRHTVAALLNAASGGVSYGLTVSEVVNGFNAAFASGDYETFKGQLELLNEAGCPLN